MKPEDSIEQFDKIMNTIDKHKQAAYFEVHKLDSSAYRKLKELLNRPNIPLDIAVELVYFMEWYSGLEQTLLTFCEAGSDVLINPSDWNLNKLSTAQEDLENLLKGEQC